MVIQNYFNFENFSFVVHFTLDQTGVLFGYLVGSLEIYLQKSEISAKSAKPSSFKGRMF